MRRLTALWVVLAVLGLGFSGTTAVAASSFTYDATTIARVHVERAAAAEFGRTHLDEAQDGSASPLVETPGTAPAPSTARNATNAAGELPGLSASRAQLEAKFKHAGDFGVAEARGASGFDAFGKAVDSFVADAGTVRVAGTYRGNPAILNYNPTTAQVVVQATDGTFVSGWKMSAAQLQNVITNGSLGGG